MQMTQERVSLTTDRSLLFQPLDFYMLRTPLLPVELFQEIFALDVDGQLELCEETIERLVQLSNDPVIREAIAVASLSLSDSLPNLSNRENPRKRDQAVKGFLRYLIRMTTRPTPFGLFSGVTYGVFGECPTLSLQPGEFHRKRTRPDMQWMLKVIQQIEESEAVVRQLHVRTNPMVDYAGTRIRLPYVSRYGLSSGGMDTSSIRKTRAVLMALQEAGQPILFIELVEHVQSAYPDTPAEKISDFLLELFRQEFLISELRPSLMISSPFDCFLEKLQPLQGIDELKAELNEIASLIEEYDGLPLGRGERLYRILVNKMKKLADTKDLVQVDLALTKEQVELPRSVGVEVAKAAEVMWRLSPQRLGTTHLADYRYEFIERYGTYREIPLLELLDEDRGLGAPATYRFPQSHRVQSVPDLTTEWERDSILMKLVDQVERRGEQELILTDEIVKQLEIKSADATQAPRSLELYFALATPTRELLEQGEFLLHIGANAGSKGAGKTFGRFVDILDEELLGHLMGIHEKEQELEPDAVFAEVVFLPHTGRSSNVALSQNIRSYEIVLGTTPEKEDSHVLPLDDLLVGCTMDSFYLKSKKLGRKVIPTTGHMLNYANSPNVYRFLRELSMEGQRSWESFQWGSVAHRTALPRVRYGQAVLSPALWNLKKGIAPFHGEMSETEWFETLQQWREEWQVPRHVYLTWQDNRILLDLLHPLHAAELQRDFGKLKESQALLLTETGPEFSEHVVESHQGHFISEFVFPLVRREVNSERNVASAPVQKLQIPQAERLWLPGGEWMFLKLYGMKKREAEFIGYPLREFCAQVEQAGLADLSFFMRYSDPEPHIRLRFHGEPARLWGELIPRIHEWAKRLQQEGMLGKLVLDTYDPEIERYGGPELIQMAERLFAADSKVVAHWIARKRAGQLEMDEQMLGVISVIDLMEQFGLSHEEQLEFMEQTVDPKGYLDFFRPQRKEYMQYADTLDEWQGLRQHPDGDMILEIMRLRGEVVRQFGAAVREQELENHLYNNRKGILASVIHLHLNRLLGTNREEERKVMTLTRHTLYNLKQVRMNRT